MSRMRTFSRNVLPWALCLVLATPGLGLAGEREMELAYLDSGQWTFNTDAVINGDILATTLDYGVQLWDVSDPTEPTLLGDYYTDRYSAHAVAWDGDLLAVTTENGYVYLLNASDPGNLSLHQVLTGFGVEPEIIFVNDGPTRWAYIAGSNGMRIRDMSDPDFVDNWGFINVPGVEVALAYAGSGTLLILGEDSGLHAVDVSDPDDPALLASVPLTGGLENIHLDGDRAAVAANDITKGFYTFDVSDPTNPQLVTQVLPDVGDGNGDLRVSDVFVDGTLLYVSTHDTGIVVYDIANLASPSYLGHDPGNYQSAKDMDFADGKAYVAHWGNTVDGVYIADLSTPASPTFLGLAEGFDYGRFAAVDDGWVYVATGDGGITYHEHVSPTNLAYRGALRIDDTWGVDATGGLVYAASYRDGLVIADLRSDPDNPVIVGELDMGPGRGVEVHDGIAYCAFWTDGIYTVDVSNPAAPLQLDNEVLTDPQQQSLNISVDYPIAATADNNGGLNLWDVSDPGDIRHLSSYLPGNRVKDVEIYGDVLYAAVEIQGLHVIDISDPESPQKVGPSISSGLSGCDVENGYLHISRGAAGVATYHVVDPFNPLLLAYYDSKGSAHAVVGSDRDLYVSDHSALMVLRFMEDTPVAILAYDLAWDGSAVTVTWQASVELDNPEFRVMGTSLDDPQLPAASIPVEKTGPSDYRAVDERLVLADGGNWAYSLQLRESGEDWIILRQGSIATDPSTPALPLRLSSYPNPFNPSTTLTFELAKEGVAKLGIYDLSGRLVKSLHEGPLAAGRATFNWDGTDERRRPAGSGIYFGRVAGQGLEDQCKLVLLR